MNRDGTLGYSIYPGQTVTPRLKRLRNKLSRKMPEVSILDVLLDCQRWPAAQGLEELGKLRRSRYALQYGMDMNLRRFVVPFTSRREHWNKFARKVQALGILFVKRR